MAGTIEKGRSIAGLPPFALLEQVIPLLSRGELESVVGNLIDLLDRLDPDPDLEDGDDDSAVDDMGCDAIEQGDLEDDRVREPPIYAIDQRTVLGRFPMGEVEIYRHN